MGKSCCAYGCTNTNARERKKEGVSFFGFPLKKPDILNAWLVRIRRTDFRPTQYSYLCSEHFTDDDFKFQPFTGRRELKADAVPSKFCFSAGDPPRGCIRKKLGDVSPVMDVCRLPQTHRDYLARLCRVCGQTLDVNDPKQCSTCSLDILRYFMVNVSRDSESAHSKLMCRMCEQQLDYLKTRVGEPEPEKLKAVRDIAACNSHVWSEHLSSNCPLCSHYEKTCKGRDSAQKFQPRKRPYTKLPPRSRDIDNDETDSAPEASEPESERPEKSVRRRKQICPSRYLSPQHQDFTHSVQTSLSEECRDRAMKPKKRLSSFVPSSKTIGSECKERSHCRETLELNILKVMSFAPECISSDGGKILFPIKCKHEPSLQNRESNKGESSFFKQPLNQQRMKFENLY